VLLIIFKPENSITWHLMQAKKADFIREANVVRHFRLTGLNTMA
jgi:hypothetical protein